MKLIAQTVRTVIPHLRAKSENWRWLTPPEIFTALRKRWN
jgi:hypothetical protein